MKAGGGRASRVACGSIDCRNSQNVTLAWQAGQRPRRREAEVPDADEALGKYVQQEAVQEVIER
jgi:hypothetical protein